MKTNRIIQLIIVISIFLLIAFFSKKYASEVTKPITKTEPYTIQAVLTPSKCQDSLFSKRYCRITKDVLVSLKIDLNDTFFISEPLEVSGYWIPYDIILGFDSLIHLGNCDNMKYKELFKIKIKK